MNNLDMKNIIVLKDLPSNIIDEAIVILKDNKIKSFSNFSIYSEITFCASLITFVFINSFSFSDFSLFLILLSKILIMKNGKIIEQGSNEELMKKQGEYYELVNT